MRKPIGLTTPFAALLAFSLLFNPWTIQRLPTVGFGAVLLSPQIFFLIAAATILRIRKISLTDTGLRSTDIGRMIALGIFLGLIPAALAMGIAGLVTLVNAIHPFLKNPIFGGETISAHFTTGRLLTLLVLAPVCEELFFRGILLRTLREQHSAIVAVILSAVIFMAAHGGFAPGPLLLGMIVGPIVLRTDSLVPAIVFHAISNLYGPILIFGFPNLYRLLSFLFQ